MYQQWLCMLITSKICVELFTLWLYVFCHRYKPREHNANTRTIQMGIRSVSIKPKNLTTKKFREHLEMLMDFHEIRCKLFKFVAFEDNFRMKKK